MSFAPFQQIFTGNNEAIRSSNSKEIRARIEMKKCLSLRRTETLPAMQAFSWVHECFFSRKRHVETPKQRSGASQREREMGRGERGQNACPKTL